ncbi:MAG: hypothetical protein KJ718_00080 [Nanoarchaeota archaeon]|nr:hypothetical protein [Nanoarchaeota archaeon]MBU1050938.1 hypothetical protein [Nanoarchaeota archaeon]MBU1988197.1 hypothetical protein [Nanoarchaeota archaeon]
MMGIEKLIDAAKKEDWETVDEQLPEVCEDPSVVSWAYNEGIKDDDGNIRDLAVSLLEKAPISESEFDDMRETVYGLMTSDLNKYVKFRAAFALAAHGVGSHKAEVEQLLHEAEKDNEIAKIARGYLAKVKKWLEIV